MIYVECIILQVDKPPTRYNKEFVSQDEFNKWYKMTKDDKDFVVNVMKYNPQELFLQKQLFDDKLVSVSREICQ